MGIGAKGWSVAAASLFFSVATTDAYAQNETAQVAPQPVLIFFDWGKLEVGSDAAGQLDGVVNNYRAAPAHLRVTSHSDRSGSAAGNRRSAERRAQAVVHYLAERGVPRSAISIISLGEERPLIATADGVREPQNRRVEILFPAPRP